LEKKIKLGVALTKDEQKRADELRKIQKQNHVTFSQGLSNFWEGLKKMPANAWKAIKESFQGIWNGIKKIYEWWQEKVSMPLNANLGEIGAAIREKLDFFSSSEQKEKNQADIKAWEAFNAARAGGMLDYATISSYARGGGLKGTSDMTRAAIIEFAKIQKRMLDKQSEDARAQAAEEAKAQAERDKQAQEERKRQSGFGARSAEASEKTAEALTKKTETSFMKEFMGNYGFTAFTGRA